MTLGNVQANPTLSKAKEDIELCPKKGVDLAPTVGEGGVTDSSKYIVDGARDLDVGVWARFHQEVVPAGILPVGVILMPSASGSEMSASCVITSEENGFKRGFDSMIHRPLFPVCNPELTCTVSRYQTACETVGIMMHTLEWYFNKTKDMELTGRITEALLKSAVEAGRIIDKDPGNYETRAVLMWEGDLPYNGLTGAGREFSIQVHQPEHELFGMHLPIAHGVGLAAPWPSWVRFVYPSDVNRFARYVVQVWNIDMDLDHPMNMALAGIQTTEDFYKSLGTPSSLKELGVGEERPKEMTVKYTNIGKHTLPGIRELGKEEMMGIYRIALGE